MILGMSLPTFTLFHVIISLLGIASGLVVVFGMLSANRLPGWTAFFLITTLATSLTGFLFPFVRFGPSHTFGVISLVVLTLAVIGLYAKHLAGAWRWIYVVGSVVALYLNVFVAVVQSFQKVAFLHPLAPTGTETPFKVAQLAVLLIFIGIGYLAVKKFHPATLMQARA
ncbi:MAG TPA: hypothetical protein VGN07_00930 [Steroidobacteraceae bacterium]